jgi:hypothetical protein
MADATRLVELGMVPQLATELVSQINGAVAAKTQVAALATLTDSSGGTAGATIVDVPASYTEATLANQLASLTAKVNGLITALKA